MVETRFSTMVMRIGCTKKNSHPFVYGWFCGAFSFLKSYINNKAPNLAWFLISWISKDQVYYVKGILPKYKTLWIYHIEKPKLVRLLIYGVSGKKSL